MPGKSVISILLVSALFLLAGCKGRYKNQESIKLFSLLKSSQTGIDFENTLVETDDVNPLQYENSYNGGGVSIGDVNNDGLADIYFSGNVVDNKLYLNKGSLKFSDVTDIAGVKGRNSWKTGTSMADVNGDGLIDIYVCHSGNLPGKQRANELFINYGNNENGVPVFKEEAERYGLADSAFSNHTAFFDYDRDGDLDMILLNHSPVRFNNLDESNIKYMLHKKDLLTGLKLYEQNSDGIFHDVSDSAHLSTVRLNYNLGVAIADINGDGWTDFYISNDYLAPDYLYINNGDGTFTDSIRSMLTATSQFSMGNDVADINNDGLPDIYTLDMLPEDNHRQKILFANDNYEIFNLRVKTGLHSQYMRNMLHVNNGDGSFSEIGQLAGVSNTDWSWAPLFSDLDNDGWKDLFVSNGYYRDYTNLDFLKYMGEYLRDNEGRVQKKHLLELVKKMPSSNQRNYAFKNNHGVSFSNTGEYWGLDKIANSNGAAYGDLDNDGDVDLVVNNINKEAFVFENNTQAGGDNHFLAVKLNGAGKNTLGIGAKVYVFSSGSMQYQEQTVSRGFQSSVSPLLHFGLGKQSMIDSVKIIWASQKQQVVKNMKEPDTTLVVNESNASYPPLQLKLTQSNIFKIASGLIEFKHIENDVNDFKRQPLLINSLSYSGPAVTKGDVNSDGLADLFVGGASGQSGSLFIQKPSGKFIKTNNPVFNEDAGCEDIDAVFFDVDNDNDMDLLVCSGGYDNFLPGDSALQPRLYLNNGKGAFSRAPNRIPNISAAGGCIAVADINGDGFSDIFWGGRIVPGNFPIIPNSYIFINNGLGSFTDNTIAIAPSLSKSGMISDAVFEDINGDSKPDLITCGDWMPIKIWINENNQLRDKTNLYFDKSYTGWWNKIVVEDINNDGIKDIIGGNYGLNTQCKASDSEPAELLYKDFDGNGAIDPLFCFYIQHKSFPYISRDELLDQISIMRRRFPDYKSYADATVKEIFTPEELKGHNALSVNCLTSKIFLSNKGHKFSAVDLPIEAQYAPVFALQISDFNNDGKKDLLVGGNITYSTIKIGSCLANYGMLFLGDNLGRFKYVPQFISGLHVKGDLRAIEHIGNNTILFGVNNSHIQAYRYQ